MRDEKEIEEMQDRISVLTEGVDNDATWQKLEAAEVALDFVLGNNNILENIVELEESKMRVRNE